MNTKKKTFKFPCPCEKKYPITKVQEVNLRPDAAIKKKKIELDAFCMGCGEYVSVEVDEDLGTDENLRGFKL